MRIRIQTGLVALALLATAWGGGGSPAAASACVDPRFVTSTPDDMWSQRGYIVHNNMWNASGYDVKQVLRACSYKNWFVRVTADNRSGDGAVKTYPNVHRDWHDWGTGAEPRLSSFKKIRSRFAARTPDVGIYNVAFDIWLNGVPGNREVMIWTENHRQVPAGNVVARGLQWSDRTWRVFATNDNTYIAFVPNKPLRQGTMPIKSMLSWLIGKGRIPAKSTLGQIGFGFEIVSTGGRPAKFKVDDFSISASRR